MKRLLVLLTLASMTCAAWANDGDTMNARFNPIGLIVGALGVNVDFKFQPDWTIGPELEYWKFSLSSNDDLFTSKYDITAFGAGARANWFYNGAFNSGLYVGPSLNYFNVKVSTTDSLGTTTGTADAFLLGCVVGYGWFWDSFNMMLGGGADFGLGSTSVNITDTSGTKTSVSTNLSGLLLEFSLGWTF